MMTKLFLLLYSFILYEKGFCQKWLTPTNRVIYSLDGKAENLSWDMDYVGKRLFNARWTVYNDIIPSEKVLVSVAGGVNAKLFHPNITSVNYMSFKDANFTGKITLHKLESSTFHRIGCIVSFHDESAQFQDFVHIRYAEIEPVFPDPLPKQQSILEGKASNFTVTLKGNPAPIILWKLKGEDVTSNPRMKVSNEVSLTENNDTIIVSTLHIKQLLAIDNGVVEVIGKYGEENMTSPFTRTKMNLDVQYAPRGISLTSNVTTERLENDNYVRLTCVAKANPSPTYTFKKVLDEIYTGKRNYTTFFITGVHEARFASFSCTASNTLGSQTSYIEIDLELEDEKVARFKDPSKVDSKWWTYFIIGGIIIFLVFLAVSIVSFCLRRRMRSLNIIHETYEEPKVKKMGRVNYGISDDYIDSPNQAYHFAAMGPSADNATRRSSANMQVFANSGFAEQGGEAHL